jgi:hypothetical protein
MLQGEKEILANASQLQELLCFWQFTKCMGGAQRTNLVVLELYSALSDQNLSSS